jgi:NAD(P)-dependent dehydrogenase (short-subunit alcohol dehydrogenase family)
VGSRHVGERPRRLLDVQVRNGHLERTQGVIINMASVNAYWAEPDLAAYSASKAAVLQLTRCIAVDHAAVGVRSAAICPGYVRTEMLEHCYQSQPDPQAVREAVTGRYPLRRLCEPDEVASLASWLASDEAGFASGQPYVLYGALTAGRSFTWNGN